MAEAIDREAYRKVLRDVKAGSPKSLWLTNCRVLDTEEARFSEARSIQIIGHCISVISDDTPTGAHIDCGGQYVLPGDLGCGFVAGPSTVFDLQYKRGFWL